jgi:aconitate hydratase
MWHDPAHAEPRFSEYLELDLSTVVPSIAGPKRPQDRIVLSEAKAQFELDVKNYGVEGTCVRTPVSGRAPMTWRTAARLLRDQGTVRSSVASITSCTNTSNPSVMMAPPAGQEGRREGPEGKPWVKTSMAPGSKVVTDYYEKAGLWPYLDKLGFNLVGYGCATCIGNSGPLPEEVSAAVNDGPRGHRGALGQPQLRGPDQPRREDELPRLAAAGHRLRPRRHDGLRLRVEPLGQDSDGNDVFLKDIWPSRRGEIEATIAARRSPGDVRRKDYADVFAGDERWQSLPTPTGDTFEWDADSTYVRKPPYFDGMPAMNRHPVEDIAGARVLPSWATRSPPTTSARPGQRSRRTPRPAYLPSTASSPRTSTPTARAAATTR